MSNTSRRQWIWFTIASTALLLFSIWASNLWLLLFLFLLFDIYVTKFVPWTFWKRIKNPAVRKALEWIDAIVFALIAVYFINTFFFQNYQIPTSSLEKSLLVGDFLFVSKMSYGPRSPMTPLSFPLAQHTMPVVGGKSYIEKPQWKYKRLKGFGEVKRNDIVVFNFPTGDTVATNMEAVDYYVLSAYNPNGSEGVKSDKRTYGDIVYRPVDRRENYVKRAIGLPGETIELKDDAVYIDGELLPNPKMTQHNYMIQTDGTDISSKLFSQLGINIADYTSDGMTGQRVQDLSNADSLSMAQLGLKTVGNKKGKLYYGIPMTDKMVEEMKARPFVWSIVKEEEPKGSSLYYPLDYQQGWTRDSFGPLWIPKKGATINFDTDTEYKVAAYNRCIKNYEGNDFEYRNGKVFINGEETNSYTFSMDYYFMMGDNRHNSADSRVWGFVPEDHVVGQPLLIWLSLEKDKGWFNGKIRWNRLFRSAKK
ncbi:MAG: S26 family signal peptidase [Bacteroidales bacterium]|nr:S26 family signal peptidase [Bacteroidales bacterium]